MWEMSNEKGIPMKLCLATILLAAGLLAAPARAAVLDQQYDFSSSVANTTNGNLGEVGQTFTVGIAGTLDQIDVRMFRLSGIFDPTGDPILSIYSTSGGLPTGSPLATATVPEASVPLNPVGTPAFVSFDVSAAGLLVNPGDVLAFAIRTTSEVGPYWLITDQGQPIEYAGGAAVSRFPPGAWSAMSPPQDHAFQTWVTPVPEPQSFVLLGMGVVALWIGRRRISR